MTTAWIAGASGLVGSALLRRLLDDPAFDRVVSAGRRPVPVEHPKLAQAIVDFADPASLARLGPADAAFAALGTTIAKAGSREAFRRVDHDAVVAFARAARERGARVLVHVSALGADPRSRVFYNAVKGEAERDVAAAGPPSVYALRPSLLDGERREWRTGERLALVVGRALRPVLGKYAPTPVDAVAEVMIACARAAEPGAHAVEADRIRPGGP